MHTVTGQAQQHIACLHCLGQQIAALYRANREPGQIVIAIPVHARHFGGFAADQGGARAFAARGDAFDHRGGLIDVQLAGREAVPMAEAARMVQDMGARIIDINMGCPAKKVTQGLSGSALMKTPDHALRLIEAVVGAVDIPVTLKTRLGWDDNLLNAPDIARRAQDAGIKMVTIHGRTRCQFYKGDADWAAISGVKQAVDIPVIANGDITNSARASCALEQSGADGVMIGRGAQGQPWILAQIAHDLYGTPAPVIPVGRAFADMVQGHYAEIIAFYGADMALRVARKHLGWYMDYCQTPPDLRRAVLTAPDTAKVQTLLKDACFASQALAA